MKIQYKNIVLRDMETRDIDDDIRWNTVETQWADWDAPWEKDDPFDPEEYRQTQLERLAKPRTGAHRWAFEIDTTQGVHIGSVSAYCIAGDYEWQESAPEGEEARRAAWWALGIDINAPTYWSGGWGTQALTAFVRYQLEEGYEHLYTQTWSGNFRMVGLAEKLGFRECRRKAGFREVRGKFYDGLTFRLDRAAFEAFCVKEA